MQERLKTLLVTNTNRSPLFFVALFKALPPLPCEQLRVMPVSQHARRRARAYFNIYLTCINCCGYTDKSNLVFTARCYTGWANKVSHKCYMRSCYHIIPEKMICAVLDV